jgi:hypothetical protein
MATWQTCTHPVLCKDVTITIEIANNRARIAIKTKHVAGAVLLTPITPSGSDASFRIDHDAESLVQGTATVTSDWFPYGTDQTVTVKVYWSTAGLRITQGQNDGVKSCSPLPPL